jgi:hypothetical protein
VLPEPVTAYGLLAGGRRTTFEPSEVHVPHELLSDLDVYPLIITPDYIGPDRRTTVRHYPDRPRPGRSLRGLEVLVIMVITMAVAIPLTLMTSHASAAGKSSRPPASSQAKASASPGFATLSMDRRAASKDRVAASQRLRAARQATRARLAAQRRASQAATALRRAGRARSAQIRRARRAEYRAALSRQRRVARAARVRT